MWRESIRQGYTSLDTHDAPFLATGAVFFRRSRLFFREAAFSSGGEGCEWGAKQPTVGESGDKAENEFSGFIPLVVLRRASALTSPPPDFLLSSIPTQATKPHQIKQPLSKIAVNEIAVGIWQKNVGWALSISHFFIFLQSTSNRH